MSIEKSYYIAMDHEGEQYPVLQPDDDTAGRPFRSQKLSGSTPLRFRDALKNERQKTGGAELITDIMFCGANLVVKNNVKDVLAPLNLQGLQIYPAVYIDNQNHWHDDYWYLNFYEPLDCLDKTRFEGDEPDDINDPFDFYDVDRYALDQDKLSKAGRERSLMFKIARTTLGYIFLHESVADEFRKHSFTGIRLFNVASFEEGDQYS